MQHNHKKLFLILGGLVLFVGLLFWSQLRRFTSIVVKADPVPLVSSDTYIIVDDATDPVLGNPGAPLSIIEYIDLGNEQSLKLHQLLTTFVLAHPKEVRLVWKDYPSKRLFSADTTLLHQAAWCAGEQNKFWPFVDTFIATRPKNDLESLKTFATSLKLNTVQWTNCLAAPATASHIAANVQSGIQVGLGVAPALFVNNKRISLSAGVNMEEMLATFVTP